ncbi:pogo transposable element with KRAB domain isoform X2 [Rhizophagus clarus]|uniref:Pogo transposable element with KRAB domain isoform X2 n=1 Tax=Rhizophagus clarus TaxID=94130 RepID=A0A8H3L0G5_9GLOM|nr:pogo transposable element with KRAB domain isoform X2 [Rhizophagus clarus]
MRSMIQMKAKVLTQQCQWQPICSGVGHIQYDYPLAYIGNMDEMPVSFDLSSNTTIDELADGTKFLPLIIFKFKNAPQGNFPPEVIIHANQKGWMNENKMLY